MWAKVFTWWAVCAVLLAASCAQEPAEAVVTADAVGYSAAKADQAATAEVEALRQVYEQAGFDYEAGWVLEPVDE